MVLFEEGEIDARAGVEAVYVRLGNKAHEVVVASDILGVQAQVEAALGFIARAVVARGSDIRLAAEDGLYGRQLGEFLLFCSAGIVKGLEREEVAVVGDGDGARAGAARTHHKRRYLALPVKERVCCVKMKMYEVVHWRCRGRWLVLLSAWPLQSAFVYRALRRRWELFQERARH